MDSSIVAEFTPLIDLISQIQAARCFPLPRSTNNGNYELALRRTQAEILYLDLEVGVSITMEAIMSSLGEIYY